MFFGESQDSPSCQRRKYVSKMRGSEDLIYLKRYTWWNTDSSSNLSLYRMMIISETRIQSFQSGDTGHGGDISQVSRAFNKQVASSISLHIDLCTMIRVYTEYLPSTSNSITRSGPQHHVIIIKSLYESPVESRCSSSSGTSAGTLQSPSGRIRVGLKSQELTDQHNETEHHRLHALTSESRDAASLVS